MLGLNGLTFGSGMLETGKILQTFVLWGPKAYLGTTRSLQFMETKVVTFTEKLLT